ncbi:hypothetical protein PF327_06910 [Sulfurovum sp. XTW-4]|uniref:Tetratricopeptide repeat-like domain-containing protein n=1 Tax=Sulfurovum xiamenensis TaxID=3019066 RepID=A0ABT7QS56_9BACT|nr:hypothetical protein [Sulfurovum xiamenensis]MDM5263925.1 hypothetical protein [Sulfurovum xiamenensis]
MGIKDDVNYVKRELSGDEKVLESAFKLESLYKKYKFHLWGVIVVLILFFGGEAVMGALHEAKLEKANEAFLTLQNNSEDANALKVLQENNPALLELYTYAQAVKKEDIKGLESLSTSTNSVIADASGYTVGVLNKKPVESKLYKEMALFEEAYLSILAGDVKKAQNKLELIDDRSSLSVIREFLMHSTVKAN